MKVYVVRDAAAGDPRDFMCLAEDAIQSAVFATIHGGPFPVDHGDLVVWDHDANRTLVTQFQRLARLRGENRPSQSE